MFSISYQGSQDEFEGDVPGELNSTKILKINGKSAWQNLFRALLNQKHFKNSLGRSADPSHGRIPSPPTLGWSPGPGRGRWPVPRVLCPLLPKTHCVQKRSKLEQERDPNHPPPCQPRPKTGMENCSPWAAAKFKSYHQKTVPVTILQNEGIVSSQVQTLKLSRNQRRTLVPSSQVSGQSRCPDSQTWGVWSARRLFTPSALRNTGLA